jgi:hypothetical protein
MTKRTFQIHSHLTYLEEEKKNRSSNNYTNCNCFLIHLIEVSKLSAQRNLRIS